jgi:hypothetical protein
LNWTVRGANPLVGVHVKVGTGVAAAAGPTINSIQITVNIIDFISLFISFLHFDRILEVIDQIQKESV